MSSELFTIAKNPHLAIKLSRSIAEQSCVFCGLPCYPFEGPELFMAESWEMVCWICGSEIAPELVEMLSELWEVSEDMLLEDEQMPHVFKQTPAA